MEGMYIKNILSDTGCLATLVHHKLVQKCKVLPRETATIHCVHGDTSVYFVASLNLEVGGVPVSKISSVQDIASICAVGEQMFLNWEDC